MRCSSSKLKGTGKLLYCVTKEACEDGLLSPYLIKVRNGTKHFADCLGPLKRFLRSKVGQPWNQVYSELSCHLDKSTLSGQHILSHLWQYVERDVEIIDGVPFRKARPFRRMQLGNWRDDEFYIHPETGLLCLAEHVPQPKPKRQRDDLVVLDAYHHYRKLNEVWYVITLADIPSIDCQFVDVLLKESFTRQTAYCEYGKYVYAVSKRQCNKKEVRTIRAKLC
jgi:hypothetical protein